MNVGELRKAIEGLSDEAEVIVDLEPSDGGELIECEVRGAKAEARDDEIALYLFVPDEFSDSPGYAEIYL